MARALRELRARPGQTQRVYWWSVPQFRTWTSRSHPYHPSDLPREIHASVIQRPIKSPPTRQESPFPPHPLTRSRPPPNQKRTTKSSILSKSLDSKTAPSLLLFCRFRSNLSRSLLSPASPMSVSTTRESFDPRSVELV